MIYLDLFLGFLKVGFFAFGGAYGAIPLIRDVVLDYGWLTDETLAYMIAVSESTPGPIMLNLATYVGASQAGVLGSVLATTAVTLPSYIAILVVMGLLQNAMKNKYVQAILRGLKPCVIGIVLATGLFMVVNNCLSHTPDVVDGRSLIMTLLLVLSMMGYKKWKKTKLPPLMLIAISAVLGTIVYGI
ncbi:MAG: chromate transporter [Firmicutes bacterium]|nr:chromate transporter [Bacillota bacterium]